MSHNVANGKTFGIDACARVLEQVPSEKGGTPKFKTASEMHYFITDYQGHIDLSPSEAALAAVLILKDVFERDSLSHLKRPAKEELAELKAVLEKLPLTYWD